MRFSTLAAFAPFASLTLLAPAALADDVLHIAGQPTLDPPTVTALGVQLLITGDDNHNANVTLRYRPSGDATWREGLPLHRVRPEVITGYTVAPQFAGSIFDLRPATSYEIELHAVDADGAVDQTFSLTGTTRAVPRLEPMTANNKSVSDAQGLSAALSAAKPGDVILIANGTYNGTFGINASGTQENPIVIRGESEDGVILDGGGAAGNVLEVYGSFVHVERLTIQNANRALRFQGTGAEGNVVRRIHTKGTTLGIGSKADQRDFYICDNTLEGPLSWPSIYTDDGGAHANDDGINVQGSGHVVCHNMLTGWGDAIKTSQDGARSIDFYGNEVSGAYDNAVELDGGVGNVRCLKNRFTNTYATISFQPIFGGPAYAIRNVVVNVAHEQLKVHALGGQPPWEPSGIYVLHNTFVSPQRALTLTTSDASHHIVLQNNLFIGPDAPVNGRTVDWSGPIDDGLFDYNGYYPEGVFAFNLVGMGSQKFANFAAAQAAGLEANGLLVGKSNFASGLLPPADYTSTLSPADVTLDASSSAVDRGVVLANINDGFQGKAPDLGALELGCAAPIYGVRPDGVDESTQDDCANAGTGGAGSGSGSGSASGGVGGSNGAGGSGGNGATPGSGDEGGCGCRAAGGAPSGAWAALLAAGLVALGRRRRAGAPGASGAC